VGPQSSLTDMTDVSPSGFRSVRDIAATPERVWEVLTTPSAFATWFGTDDASIDQRDTVMFELAGAEANGCSLTLSQPGGGRVGRIRRRDRATRCRIGALHLACYRNR